jgi:hypothetical protein
LKKCSYIPISCQNDPIYTEKVLVEFYQKYFPPENSHFKCFISKNEKNEHDSLLYLPDSLAYKCIIVVLIFGIMFGFLFIFIGFKARITKLPFNKNKLFKKYLKDIHYNHFDLNEILAMENELEMNSKEKKDDNIELTIFSNNLKNNLTINDNINRNHNLSNEDFKKLTDAGYHIGRIGYPSALSFKQNASKSASLESLSSHEEPLIFSLDSFTSNEKNFDDEDENNVQKNIHSILEEDEVMTSEARMRKSVSTENKSLTL